MTFDSFNLSYILAIVFFLLISWAVFKFSRLARLYLLALLTPKGRITHIVSHVDGDTVRVVPAKNQGHETESIRLIGIDTPESRKSLYMDIAPFGKEAAEYTKMRLPKGQRVILIFDQQKQDKFGRTLAYLYLPNGEFYNASLLSNGYAWTAQYPPNLKYAAFFEELQEKAKAKEKPIWKVYESKGVLTKKFKRSAEYRKFAQYFKEK
jgi:micrococcal nuclease